MQEWSDKYNSFNSLKGLMFINEYEAILKGKLLPPINVSLAPHNGCNLNCEWCNSRIILNKKPVSMSQNKLKKLLKSWLDWGVKGYCFAGTGEPSLYPHLDVMTKLIKDNGGESAMITNGTLISYEPENFKYIGISLDAGSPKTYKLAKGSDLFYKVLDNIKQLVGKTEITIKYLFHPDNCHEIHLACQIAKRLGADNFHIRPACLMGFEDIKYQKYTGDQLKSINKQIGKCFILEDDKFKVYGVRHKFSEDFGVSNNFKKCLASPLLFCAEADGYAYLCLEHRGKEEYKLCKLEDIKEFWGSKEHLKLIKSITPKKCLARCTLCGYQEQIEHCVIKDKMNRRFP